LTMRALSLVLVCAACTGHGHRILTKLEGSRKKHKKLAPEADPASSANATSVNASQAGEAKKSEIYGFLAILGAASAYGTSYVPARSHEVHDGLVFNWYESIGFLVAGIAFALCYNKWDALAGSSPAFYVHREGLVAGMLYQVGSVMATQAVHKVGIGNYYIIHEITNVGASLFIGFLGPSLNIPVTLPSNKLLAFVGFFIVALGMVPTMFMREETDENRIEDSAPPLAPPPTEAQPVRSSLTDLFHQPSSQPPPPAEPEQKNDGSAISGSAPTGLAMLDYNAYTWDGSSPPPVLQKAVEKFHHMTHGLPTIPILDNEDSKSDFQVPTNIIAEEPAPRAGAKNTKADKLLGIVFSLAAGGVYGVMFAPIYPWKKRMLAAGMPADPFNFVFAACVGCSFCSTVWLLFWSTIKKIQKKRLDKSVLRPALLAGVIFYAGMMLQFYAVAQLPYAVAYVSCTGLSLAFSMSWGLFVFGEMRGCYNRVMAALSFGGVIIGAGALALSA